MYDFYLAGEWRIFFLNESFFIIKKREAWISKNRIFELNSCSMQNQFLQIPFVHLRDKNIN